MKILRKRAELREEVAELSKEIRKIKTILYGHPSQFEVGLQKRVGKLEYDVVEVNTQAANANNRNYGIINVLLHHKLIEEQPASRKPDFVYLGKQMIYTKAKVTNK